MSADKYLSRLQEDSANAAMLQEYWTKVLPTAETPSIEQFRVWARTHRANLGAVVDAFDQTSRKFSAVGGMSLDHLIRYASKNANSNRSLKAA